MRPTASLLLLLAACAEDEAAPEERARLVETVRAARETAVERLVLLGDVHGEREVRVFTEMPERIRTLHVTEGARVEVGDPIATLDAGLPQTEAAQAAAALLAAEASRDRIAADLRRVRPLVEAQALARTQQDTLEAQLRAAEAQVTQLSAGRRAANLRRARTVVRAPSDGIIAQLAVSEGDMATPSMPLCAVVQMDRVEVRVRVVEEDYVRLREGMRAEVLPTAFDARFEGQVANVSPVLDRLTRTALVKVRVDNEAHRLRPGMVAEVGLELERREEVLMVPSRAVLMTTRTARDRSASVYVVAEDSGELRARRRRVRLGRRYPAAEAPGAEAATQAEPRADSHSAPGGAMVAGEANESEAASEGDRAIDGPREAGGSREGERLAEADPSVDEEPRGEAESREEDREPTEGGESRLEVRSGLSAGDRVVVRGQHLLRDGAAVRTRGQGPPGRGGSMRARR